MFCLYMYNTVTSHTLYLLALTVVGNKCLMLCFAGAEGLVHEMASANFLTRKMVLVVARRGLVLECSLQMVSVEVAVALTGLVVDSGVAEVALVVVEVVAEVVEGLEDLAAAHLMVLSRRKEMVLVEEDLARREMVLAEGGLEKTVMVVLVEVKQVVLAADLLVDLDKTAETRKVQVSWIV